MTTQESRRMAGLPPWLFYTLLAAAFWGVWGVVTKVAADAIPPLQNQLLFTIGLAPSALWAAQSRPWKGEKGTKRTRGLGWGLLAGLLAALGNLAVFASLTAGGKAAIVIPLTSVYPLVTLLLAWLWLGERLNAIQAIGLVVALPALLLLSGETSFLGRPGEFFRQLALSKWLLYALVGMVFWGVFSVVQKVSTNHISAELSYLAWCAAFLPIAGVILVTQTLHWGFSGKFVILALVAGALNGFGVVASFAAYSFQGKAAIVTPIAAAVQPVVTVLLALAFLGERVESAEVVGLVLAIVAAVLLSLETPRNALPAQSDQL
jgi:uncharacterized membrane protein